MKVKTIVIELRKPANKTEKGTFGMTYDHGPIARIFIDSRKNKGREFVDTFFHEMVHVFTNFTSPTGKIADEEKKCRLVGQAAKKIIYGE